MTCHPCCLRVIAALQVPLSLVATFLKNSRNHINGPVMILLSHAHAAEGDNDIVGEITRLFASASDHSWKTITFPQFA